VDDLQYVEGARGGFRAFSTADNGPAGPAEPVARVEDLSIVTPAATLAARLYKSAGAQTGPLLVYFHGGGFIAGDLETHDRPLRAVANRCSATILSVVYRLAPENPYPAPVEDAYAAALWAAQHAAELGADPRRIVIGGDSAGGTLTALIAIVASKRGGPKLAGQILIYPGTDLRPGAVYPSWEENNGRMLTRIDVDRMYQMYLPQTVDPMDPAVSPLFAPQQDLSSLPPALVITAEFDPLRDEGELYATRLHDAGVPVTLTRYPGMIHGFLQMPGALAGARRAIDQIAQALSAAPTQKR
jgi:acetyl esterase